MKKALFLHIQKTAGTSVQEIARAHYGNDAVCSHGDFLEMGQTASDGYDFLSGHFGVAFARPFLAERYAFTFLRDPVARVVSFYDFVAGSPPDGSPVSGFATSLSLLDFVRKAHRPGVGPHIWNHQVWQLCHGYASADLIPDPYAHYEEQFRRQEPEAVLEKAIANLDLFDYVGLAETFDADIRAIFRDLGAPEIVVPHANPRPSAIGQGDLDHETRAAIEDVTRLDQALYEAAKARRG